MHATRVKPGVYEYRGFLLSLLTRETAAKQLTPQGQLAYPQPRAGWALECLFDEDAQNTTYCVLRPIPKLRDAKAYIDTTLTRKNPTEMSCGHWSYWLEDSICKRCSPTKRWIRKIKKETSK